MTFSITGRDESTGKVGVAIASVFPSVGAVCPYVTDGVAISSQAWDSGRSYGDPIVNMVDDEIALESACETILANRDGAEGTQLHGVSLDGDRFAYTGDRAADWAGHVVEDDHTVAGNILAGESVVTAMSTAFTECDSSLEERLLTALTAGEDAGGDKRGDNLSAALLVRAPESSLRHNLRVDDPGDPISGLWNAYETAVESESRDGESLEALWGGEYPESIVDFRIKY